MTAKVGKQATGRAEARPQESEKAMVNTLQQLLVSSLSLDRVAHLWGLSKGGNVERQQWIEALLERMKQPQAARCVWERLATPQERVLLWHCVGKTARRGIGRKDLLTVTQLTREEFDAALSCLTEWLLLMEEPLSALDGYALAGVGSTLFPFVEQAETLYQTGRELFLPGAQRATMSLSKLLQKRPEAELWRMIHHYALDVTGLRRESDLRTALAEALTDADLVLGALTRLPTSVREVFSWLMERGGQAAMQNVWARFALDDDALFALLETLSAYGLAFDTLCPDVSGLRLLFVPQALSENMKMKATLSTSTRHRLVPLPVPPATVYEGVPALVGDLAVVVNAVNQLRVELTREGTVVKHCATRIRPLLRGQVRPGMFVKNIYLDLLFETAERLLLIQRVHPPFSLQSLKPYYEPGPGIGAWGRLSLVEQTQHLFSWWAMSPHWQDVIGKDFQQWNPVEWKPLAARPLLISALQKCILGAWYRIDDLLQHIWETEPYALHPGCQKSAQGLRPTAVFRAKWLRCEGEVLRGILTSTLWELGLVSLGGVEEMRQETQESSEAFQITELGASILKLPVSQGDCAFRSNGDSLVFLPTGEVLLLELDTVTLYRLLPYVEIRQMDRAIRLAFTYTSVTQGIDHGHTLEDLVAWLEALRQPPPQNVLYQLRDWAAHYVVADMNHVVLIAFSSEDAVRQLTSAPRFRSWGLRRLAPRLIGAPANTHLGELRRALEDEGIVVHLGEVLAYPAHTLQVSEGDHTHNAE